jgi:hypothetical protein
MFVLGEREMKTQRLIGMSILMIISSMIMMVKTEAQVIPNPNIKVYGYLVTWALKMNIGASNYENCLYTNVDWNACTDYIIFDAQFDASGAIPSYTQWDGNLAWGTPTSNTLVQSKRRFLNDYIHSKGKSIQLCFFVSSSTGWGTLISTPAGRAAIIKTVVDSVIGPTNRYDGLHWDIEPMNVQDTANVRIFLAQMRDTLDKYHQWVDTTKKPEQTVAIYNNPSFWGRVSSDLDGILHMSYNMFGSWNAVTWLNAPVNNTGYESANVGSIKGYIDSYISAGIPRNKLVMACPFNYNAFRGGSTPGGEGVYAPLLPLTTFPTWINTNNEMYYDAWNKWIDTATTTLHHDTVHQAAWIGYNNAGSTDDWLILFQDTMSVRANLQYISSQGIQGAMVWEICGAYINNPNQIRHPGLAPDHLLQAVKKTRLALLGLPSSSPMITVTPASLSFGNLALAATSTNQTYSISASNLTPSSGSISLAAPTGYTISTTSDGGFSSSLTVAYANNTLSPTIIYVRFSPTAVQTYSGVIVNSGGGASPQNVTVSGSGVSLSGSLSASPQVLPAGGGSVTLTWSSQNALSASFDQGIGSVALNDSITITITSTKTYNLTLANNESSAQYSITVTVSTPSENKPEEIIYQDIALASAWNDIRSWSVTRNYNSTNQVFEGSSAVQITHSPWASLQFSKGTWGSFTPIDPISYDYLTFAIHGGSTGVTLQVTCVDNSNVAQKTAVRVTAPANTWSSQSIPMDQLASSPFTAIAFTAGSANTTFSLDELDLVKKATTDVGSTITIPKSFSLEQNYPNPFNPTTEIGYHLSVTCLAQLIVYDILGKEITTLVNQIQQAGHHSVTFNANNLANGMYFAKLQAEGKMQIKKMILIK